jgi:hypothetical protein
MRADFQARIAAIFNEFGTISAGFCMPADARTVAMFKASFRCEGYASNDCPDPNPFTKINKQLSTI